MTDLPPGFSLGRFVRFRASGHRGRIFALHVVDREAQVHVEDLDAAPHMPQTYQIPAADLGAWVDLGAEQ